MAIKRDGFTIVELLIVIVVIAILAALTTAAFNGVQDRAEANKTSAAVAAYVKALRMYKLDNGVYPVINSLCLGDRYPSPSFTGGTGPQCRHSTSPIGAPTTNLNLNLLNAYLGSQKPMPSTQLLHSLSGAEFIGAHFYGSNYSYKLDGKPVVTVEYYIKSDSCPVGPVYNATAPNFTSPPVQKSADLLDGSRCFLLLADD